eukprot:767086-Hanusia_phi.AAC.6
MGVGPIPSVGVPSKFVESSMVGIRKAGAEAAGRDLTPSEPGGQTAMRRTKKDQKESRDEIGVMGGRAMC